MRDYITLDDDVAKYLKPPKPSKRSEGKVLVCSRCRCSGKTLLRRDGKYICRDCLVKEEGRR